MDVLEDVPKGHEKEMGELKKVIAELVDIIASSKKRNAELDEKRKKALKDYYGTAAKPEDAQGLIVKLTAQINHNYKNSSMSLSKCINRKKSQTAGKRQERSRVPRQGIPIIRENPWRVRLLKYRPKKN